MPRSRPCATPAAAFFVILLVTLFFGLKPKGYRFINQVKLQDSTVAITNIGMMYSKATLGAIGISDSLRLYLTLKPYQTGKRLSRLLSVINEQGNELFTVDQWMRSIEISLWDGNKIRVKRAEIDSVISADTFNTIGVSISTREIVVVSQGNTIKINRRAVSLVPGFMKHGRLILGMATDGRNPWQGEIKKLVVSGGQGTITETPPAAENTSSAAGIRVSACFYFDSLVNRAIPDRSGNRWDLAVPRIPKMFRYEVLVLMPDLGRIDKYLITDIVVNFAGFFPFGAACFFLLYTCGVSRKKALLLTVLFGLIVSLGIEIWQIFIPTRASQLTDVILNGMGAWAGAKLMQQLK